MMNSEIEGFWIIKIVGIVLFCLVIGWEIYARVSIVIIRKYRKKYRQQVQNGEFDDDPAFQMADTPPTGEMPGDSQWKSEWDQRNGSGRI